MAKKTAHRNLVVEVQLRDGTMSMHVGRLVRRTTERIVLIDAAFIACTGRRHSFFAGELDANVEIEPLPDGTTIDLPMRGSVITDWPHPLPRSAV